MTDTLIAYRFGERLPSDEGEWESSDPNVVSVRAGGVVTSASFGSAVVRLGLEDHADSTRITVVKPPGGQIVFTGLKNFDDPYRPLWLMNADGTNLRQLHVLADGERTGNPDFSPDGCRVAYQFTSPTLLSPTLRVIDLRTGADFVAGGGGEGGLPGVGPMAWGPDGKRIYLSALGPGGFDIFSIAFSLHPDSTDLRQHSSVGDPVASSLDVSPDGGRVLFSHALDTERGLESDLHWLDLASGGVTPFLERPGVDESGPSIHPDGELVAFWATLPGGTSVEVVGQDLEPRKITPTTRVQITPEHPEGLPSNARSPSFSPEGEWIAVSWNRDARILGFTTNEKGNVHQEINTVREIYVMRRDGSFPVRLTHFAVTFNPAWGRACP